MIFLYAFLVGGGICVIGQILLDRFKFTPAHITALFVTLGAALDTFELYDRLIEFAGAGAMLPITSFGHSLIHGAMESAYEMGFLGLGLGMFKLTASGITVAILSSFFIALFFKPRG